MTGKTEAIVLNKIKYGDNSLIVNFYSLDFGRFAAIIRIPKTSRNGIKPSLFFPLNIVETEVILKNTRNINSLKYCNRKYNLDNLCSDIFKLSISQFLAEVINKTIKEEEQNPQVYEFIRDTIIKLNQNDANISDLHLFFLKDFAAISGFGITNNFCPDTPFFNIKEGMFLPMLTSTSESIDITESRQMSHLLDNNYNPNSSYFNYKVKTMLIEKLLDYYKMHISGFGEINSFKILKEVFND
jgi:DNA repair protein RecO (recombination protein O)